MPTTTKSTPTAASGSETLSEKDFSRLVTLTEEIFGKCPGPTLEDIRNATSLQELVAGPTPSDYRCGQTIDLFGQEVAPASPSVQPEKAKHQAMNATSGPNGSDLSEQFDRQSSLANRLKRQLDGVGSTLFTLTWKRKATPLGRPYYQLAASGRRISDSDCGSWPTPNAGPQNDGDTTWQERRKELKEKHGNGNGFGMVLGQAVQLASWPTPATADTGISETARQGGENLSVIASWATPTRQDAINDQILGLTSPGSPAQTESKGQLNPAFSLWLMGYPAEWLNCAPQATRSSRKSPQSS